MVSSTSSLTCSISSHHRALISVIQAIEIQVCFSSYLAAQYKPSRISSNRRAGGSLFRPTRARPEVHPTMIGCGIPSSCAAAVTRVAFSVANQDDIVIGDHLPQCTIAYAKDSVTHFEHIKPQRLLRSPALRVLICS